MKRSKIYEYAKIPHPENVVIGDHCSIEDFTLLNSSKIQIGEYVEIGTGTKIVGKGELILKNFVTISPNCVLITSTPDLHRELAVSSTVPNNIRTPIIGKIIINQHCFVGAGTVILPNVKIERKCVVGAMSFVPSNSILLENSVYVGCPVKRIGRRFRKKKKIDEGDK